MDLKIATSVAAFFTAIAFLTSIASTPVGKPDKEAATAEVIRYALGSMLGEDTLKNQNKVPEILICLTSEASLDVVRIGRKLTDTIVKVVPVSVCSSKTVKGNFGMFVAVTTYFGPDGQKAGHLSVPRVSCLSSRNCEVDIDTGGSGYRYWVKQTGGKWNVVSSQMQWVV